MSVSRDLYGSISLTRPSLGYDLRGKQIVIYPKERDEGTWIRGIRRKSHRCVDCGAAHGQFHTEGCDYGMRDEACPRCRKSCLECRCVPPTTDWIYGPRVPYVWPRWPKRSRRRTDA
jgi:hypothetical protein